MAQNNAINFLPQVFRSDTNQRFLGATVDQLINDSTNRPVSGYIGRTFAPTYKLGDNYVPEIGPTRQHYQLEPSVVVKDDNQKVVFNAGYMDLLRSISNNKGSSKDHQRLFSAETYNYDGRFDYDKFINYTNYYWLPDGPDSVEVNAGSTPYQANYTVTRNTAVGGYTFTGQGGHPNTQLTLARGGTYQFVVSQPGIKFWIQSKPGTSGIDPQLTTISTREVFGVTNNGADVGTITFNVPQSTSQDFYTQMPVAAGDKTNPINAAVTIDYTKIQNRLLSDFLSEFPDGLDGVNNLLNRKTFLFIGNQVDDTQWTTPDLPAGATPVGTVEPGSVIGNPQRTSVWQINLIPLVNGDSVIHIEPTTVVAPQERVFINSGLTYANIQFWLNSNYRYAQIPAITAAADYLYYQDATDPTFTGQIKLVDNKSVPIDIANDVLGKSSYTSPNGVVFTNGLKITFDSLVTPATYANNTYYVEGVGTAIKLVSVADILVPSHLATIITTTPDYLTINRASQDKNPWSGTNRWFHKDVLAATAKYNTNSTINYGPNIPARRPIIEFDADLQLWNYGRQAKTSVDLFIQTGTDAFVDIEGPQSYPVPKSLQGITLTPGLRIIFSNDYDINVRNNIWQVSIEEINSSAYVRLIATSDDPIVDGENIFVKSGTNADRVFAFNGTTDSWAQCQYKATVNQAPVFDLVDANGYSFGDTTVYPSTTFAGTHLFSYATGTGTNDTVLGFPLKYQNFNNIGDIVFNNYYDTDSFTYVENLTTQTINCNTGYLKQNSGLSDSTKLNNWVKGVEESLQYQVQTQFFEGRVITDNNIEYAFFRIDVTPDNQKTIPYIKVFQNNNLLVPGTDYQVTKYGAYDIVLFTNNTDNSLKLAVGDKIDIEIYSSMSSQLAFYQVPANLDYNPLNENFTTITLGQLRNHYKKLIENTAVTANSSRPIHDTYVKAQGGTLLQQSSPLVYAMAFINDPDANFFDAIDLARREYAKFKNKFLSLCGSLTTLNYNDPVAGVDTILQNINAIKNNSFPWYHSDMVPQGSNYSTIVYTVNNTRQTNYEISSIFNSTQLSGRAVLVYLNGEQLTLGQDYSFSTVSPAIIFSDTMTLSTGDTITIRDYASTDGNYIPETPSKLGLYPKFVPELYTDISYQLPVQVIRGHDGSIIPAFGDFRDNYLLELERRIYNNIKANYQENVIDLYDIIPGRFRNTEYSLTDWNLLLSKNFLQWTGSNNLDYTTNKWFDADNPWTWNYATGFRDVIDDSLLQGSWRAVYNYWYDTDTPNSTPWQMLGFSTKPTWWETRYGTAPYTNGNTVLWEDLEAGYVWNNGNAYTDERFARPGLTSFIPVDAGGNLLSPTAIPLTTKYSSRNSRDNFAVGAQGPIETAWRRSSDFPYAMQVAVALSKPAKYFSTQLDVSRFYVNPITGHLSDVNNQKIKPSLIVVNGDSSSGTVNRASGYLNWIADSIKNVGIDPVTKLNSYLRNFNVQLNYKIAGFTDQKLITVTAEQTSPGSTNASVIIPNENYQVYLNKSVPLSSQTYSAVIVESTEAGYSVVGYDNTNPFFTIIPSVVNNNKETIAVLNNTISIYQDAQKATLVVPYGTTFSTVGQVVDFLISYERYLKRQGFKFEQFDQDLQVQRDFRLSAQEFTYWTQQGFPTGTVIVLNPCAEEINITSGYSVVDEITNLPGKSRILDQNFNPIKNNSFNIIRTNVNQNINNTKLVTLTGATICYVKFNLVQFEHTLIFDNVDDFGDIIYLPKLGNRQYRLGIKGSVTGNWNGSMSATGYVYSDPIIQTWQQGTDYRLGDIVKFNNGYYTAAVDNPASTNFGSGNWTKIDPTAIQTGLLPSLGTNAAVFDHIYDIDQPPDNVTLQKFSAGLLGFRERPYLTDLGLSIPDQTKFYQGFIKQKGTTNSINALTRATFNNVNGSISTYEEWAFQVGQYGDIDNNKFTEFVLDQSVFNTNPIALQLSDTYNAANIVVNLAVTGNTTTSNVYNSSNISSSVTSIYDNRTINDQYIHDLPYAGFVNLNDINKTIFDLTTYGQVADFNASDKVWTAKDYNGLWNVFRVAQTNLIATKLTYTLDNYVRVDFDNPHNFVKNDFLLIKQFDKHWDGLYRVVNIPNQLSITIQIQDKQKLGYLISVSPATGAGLIYRLISFVVDGPADFASIRPEHDWAANEKVWVKNTSQLGWGVYEFNRPWHANTVQNLSSTAVAKSALGSATAASPHRNWLYVGAPGNNSVAVFANVAYTYSANTTITSTDSLFGATIATAKSVVAVGAPGSGNVHVYTNTYGTITPVQTITSGNTAGLGTSIDLSADAHWLYVTEPGVSQVHAYWTANTTPGAINYLPVGVIASNSSAVKTNATGNVVIIGAADDYNTYTQNGNVYIYTQTANVFTPTQTLSSQHKNPNANFGASLAVDATAGNIFVGVPNSTASVYSNGLVERWVWTGSQYVFNNQIDHPMGEPGTFGVSLSVSDDAQVLAVGSGGSTGEEDTTFDNDSTVIDASTTKFIDLNQNSGAVYTFEPMYNFALQSDYGLYQYIQKLSAQIHDGDLFGASVYASRDVLLVGAPGVNLTAKKQGQAHVYVNSAQTPGWTLLRQQQPRVDTDSINRTFLYNKANNNILAALDYIDPNKGKVLNSVAADIDYQRVEDPAVYNGGNMAKFADYHWGPDQVGRIWWNLDTVRFIDYEQDSLIYRLNHWGQMFPGSSIDVYEWVESTVLPSKYTGDGTPLYADDSAYSTYGYVDQTGNVKVKYYFWVQNKTTINSVAGKKNSAYSIASAIENPLRQGVPYAAILQDNAIALYNVNNLLNGKSSVLHLTSRSGNAGLIHSEYALVQEGNPSSLLPKTIKTKLIDSLSGIDAAGNPVPDPTLTPAQAYGINIRPRQSMFVSRQNALTNYLGLVNSKLAQYPVTRRKVLTTLNSSETAPNASTGLYNQTVATDSELSYIDTGTISSGYKVLVTDDQNNNGRWAIYTWSGTAWIATRVQAYKTNLYWSYVNWYDSTYDPTVEPTLTVATTLELGKRTLTADTYIKVSDAGNGKFEIYYVDSSLNKTLVGIEGGTIQINSTTIPGAELRNILLSMQTEIFIDDLATDYNQIFFALIKYALTEQKNTDWVFKTSFLTATQYLRKLEQFPSYIADNQNFYLDYINEVKPYRTVMREFVVDYQKNDQYSGDVTDFDLPPYWDSTLQVYRSPNGEQGYDAELLSSLGQYNAWNTNYTYKLVGIRVNAPGSGYLTPPQIIITDEGGHGATAYATLDSKGGVASIVVTSPGTNFVTAPKIIINGSGSGAIASPILRTYYTGFTANSYNLIRSIGTTIKFDRTNYKNANTFVFWDTFTSANIGQQIPDQTVIRTDDVIYKLAITDWTANTVQTVNSLIYANGNTYVTTGNTYGAVFTNTNVLSNVQLVTANARSYTVDANLTLPINSVTSLTAKDFDNANDRITAFNGNVDYSLTTDGISYPGVIVDGNTFVGTNFDTIIQSSFTSSVGVNPSDINVDGGAFVSQYTSHAPQELVPGRMYDSLNLTVYDQDSLSYRIFDDMNQNIGYFRIANQNTTTLAANLALTDTQIFVADATKLPLPDRFLGNPGVVFVNGEKITYWRNYALETPTPWVSNLTVAVGSLISHASNTYITTGNVFAQYFANITANTSLITNRNVLTQIRRAADGTSARALHTIGSRVVDSSVNQSVPVVKPVYNTLTSNVAYQVTDPASVTLGLQLTSPISANIGDVLSQQQFVDTWQNAIYAAGEYVYWEGITYTTSGNTMVPVVAWQSNTVYATGTYITQAGNTYVSKGNIWAQNVSWTANTSFPLGSNVYIGSNSYYTTTGNVYVSIPTWTSNTTFAANTSIYHNGNVYRVTGNVYAPNVTWYPGIILPVGSYMYYAGATYLTLGNVGYIGNTVVTNFNNLGWRVKQVDTTIDSGFAIVQNLGNVVNAGSILQFSNIAANVQFLYKGINAGFNTVKGNVQYLPTMDISWKPNTAFTLGAYVSNNGNIYVVNGNVYGSTFSSISSNVSYSSPLQSPMDNQFASLITAGRMTPTFTGNTITSVTLKVMDTVSNVTTVPVIITVGSITNLPEIFDGTGFDVESFDNVPGALYINGNAAYSFVKTAEVLGRVNLYGTANINIGSNVRTETAWYNRGISTPIDGYGLINSITAPALFLQAERGFTPDPGTTP